MAQDIKVQPSPRQVNVTGKSMTIPVAFRLVGEQEANPHAIALLKQFLGDRLGTEGFPLYVGEKGDRAVRGAKRLIPDHPEGYYLSITDKAIMLAGNDERGTYYAVRTFMQLFHEGHLPFVGIQDYPDVRFRGVVEGFYGTPWSHEARLRQLQFYGENKLNTYIYGPKDDPFHSSPNWRKPYPAKEAARLAELVKVANENEVDFVWAIHPGLDIRWETSDRDSLMAKFEHMYDLGVRSFAVFFDDTLFRLVQAEQNAHQGAFARSVFAEQGMYLTFFELKGNIIIGNYARKALCYMQHFYRICLFQNPNLPFRS